ncbi:MAG TPA: penicillin-binding transpeptidase domain-containing protein, partial [Acidimicrobiales bacterium]|nr:penicillin-binding transpeptidase domain-containing protein [Acidimicrobiales bacterium]
HGGYIQGAFVGSFAGFAPAENPVLSAIVVLNNPTPIYGGSVAAPVFSTIVQYALQHYGIPTTAAPTPSSSVGAVGGPGSIKVQAGVTTEGP